MTISHALQYLGAIQTERLVAASFNAVRKFKLVPKPFTMLKIVRLTTAWRGTVWLLSTPGTATLPSTSAIASLPLVWLASACSELASFDLKWGLAQEMQR